MKSTVFILLFLVLSIFFFSISFLLFNNEINYFGNNGIGRGYWISPNNSIVKDFKRGDLFSGYFVRVNSDNTIIFNEINGKAFLIDPKKIMNETKIYISTGKVAIDQLDFQNRIIDNGKLISKDQFIKIVSNTGNYEGIYFSLIGSKDLESISLIFLTIYE